MPGIKSLILRPVSFWHPICMYLMQKATREGPRHATFSVRSPPFYLNPDTKPYPPDKWFSTLASASLVRAGTNRTCRYAKNEINADRLPGGEVDEHELDADEAEFDGERLATIMLDTGHMYALRFMRRSPKAVLALNVRSPADRLLSLRPRGGSSSGTRQ